jgi:hypothetical protein
MIGEGDDDQDGDDLALLAAYQVMFKFLNIRVVVVVVCIVIYCLLFRLTHMISVWVLCERSHCLVKTLPIQ